MFCGIIFKANSIKLVSLVDAGFLFLDSVENTDEDFKYAEDNSGMLLTSSAPSMITSSNEEDFTITSDNPDSDDDGSYTVEDESSETTTNVVELLRKNILIMI